MASLAQVLVDLIQVRLDGVKWETVLAGSKEAGIGTLADLTLKQATEFVLDRLRTLPAGTELAKYESLGYTGSLDGVKVNKPGAAAVLPIP